MIKHTIQKITTSIGLGLAILPALLALPFIAAGEGPDKADIIVQFGDNDAIVRQVDFTAPISGLKALELTGLNVETVDLGGGFIAVCSINGVGNPASNCFAGSKYWGYNFWNGSDWEGYMVGAATSVITNGAVEGWRWGEFGDSMVYAPPFTATAKALAWLQTQQVITDGGYGNIGGSVEAMLSIGANKMDAAQWGTPALRDYVYANGASYANSGAAGAGKLAVAIVGANGRWPVGAKTPMDYYVTQTGIYTGGYGAGFGGGQAWGILGTIARGETAPAKAVDYLKGIANADGGWGWGGQSSDTNGTALAIQALVAGGEPVTATIIISALTYLQNAQNPDGGFPYDPLSPFGTDSDTNSTAYVLQALHAAGQPFTGGGTGTWPGGTGSFGSLILTATVQATDYLLGMQLPDGSFEWQPGSGANLLATEQSIPALLGKPFPLKIVKRQSVYLPLVMK